MGSTDKIMVALVALKQVEAGKASLADEVTVSEDAAAFATPLYSNVGLFAGDTLSVRELLAAALIPSGNDAAYALAEHLGGGSVDAFVEMMNREAGELGLQDTRFKNPMGLDDRGQYSSARDLAAMARAASAYPEFREIVATPEAVISTQDREIQIVNTNLLVVPNSGYDYGPATGIKTGTSLQAGPCLVASATSGDESYIAVVLDAAGDFQRFDATTTLLEYGFGEFENEPLVKQGDAFANLELPYRRGESVKLVAARNVTALAGPGLEVERQAAHEEAPPTAKKGQELGNVEVSVEGRDAGSSPLIAQQGYQAASLWQKITYWAGGLKRWVLQR